MNVGFPAVALGAIAFLVVGFGLYWLATRLTSLGDDERDSEDTHERLSMGDTQRHRRVGYRQRVSRQTPMMKTFLASLLVLLLYFTVAIYQVAQTGTPSDAAYSGYVQYGFAFLLCVVAGVMIKAKQSAKAGEIQIMKEQDEGNDRQTIKFDRSLVRTTENGRKLVPQLKSTPLLGLFWRPVLTVDDPELRDSDHRLPGDLVLWEVPNDDSAVWDELAGEVTVRAKKVDTVDNPNRVADYEIVPSERKSKSEIDALENEINELESELNNERIQIGILTESLTDVENILTNEEHSSLKRIQRANEALEDTKPDHEHYYDDRDHDQSSGKAAPSSD